MSLADDIRPPLPKWVTDAYTVLSAHIAESDADIDDGHRRVPAINRERAIDVLYASDELTFERADAEYAIKRLIERGYLYEVDAELRVTTPAE